MKKDDLKLLRDFEAVEVFESLTDTYDADCILQIQNLTIVINGKVFIHDVNLSLKDSKIYGIFGPSGAGKTLVFNTILGLVDEKVVEGEFILGKYKIDYSTYKQLLRDASVLNIPQDPFSCVNPNMTIFEHFRVFNDYNPIIDENYVISILESVQIQFPEKTLYKLPLEVSGGQLQRFVIALVLSRNPKLILADEPTAALDVCNEINVFHLLTTLSKKYEFSVLLVSHNVPIVSHYCDTIYVVKNGTLVHYIEKD